MFERTITTISATYTVYASGQRITQTSDEERFASITGAEYSDPDQAWFWSETWQKKEQEADADLAAGRFSQFDSSDDFLNSL